MRRLISLIGLVAILSATLWLIAVPGVAAGNPCFHDFAMPNGSAMPDDTAAAATTVALDPCAFAPTVTSVAVGATVTFRNTSPFSHLVTGADQAWGSRDTELTPGASVSYAFDTAGLYPYACALHPGMSGVIVVGDPEAIAAAAVGSTSGTTAGTTTNDTPSVPVPAAGATTGEPVSLVGLVALAIAAGIAIGALVTWLIARRRPTRDEAVTATAS